MSTRQTAGTTPTRGSTAGAGAAESFKGTVHHIQGASNSIRENAMDFVDTMFGTPRQSGESRAGAAKTGDDVTRADNARAGGVGVPGRADDPTARTTTSTATQTDEVPARPSGSSMHSTALTGAGTAEKGGGTAEAASKQPPSLPPRSV